MGVQRVVDICVCVCCQLTCLVPCPSFCLPQHVSLLCYYHIKVQQTPLAMNIAYFWASKRIRGRGQTAKNNPKFDLGTTVEPFYLNHMQNVEKRLWPHFN